MSEMRAVSLKCLIDFPYDSWRFRALVVRFHR
jgi:hypothetical protein